MLFLKIIGIIIILLGLLGILTGAENKLFGSGHDLSASIYHDLFLIVMGIGLFFEKKWGIIMFSLLLLLLSYFEIKLILNKGMNKELSFMIVMLLIYFLLIVFVFTKWNKCKWK